MTSGFGVDRAADGLSGTSSQDIRRINGALYSPGIISGCAVTTSASVMSYTVAAGVVAIRTAVGEIVLAPVNQSTVAAASAPVTGERIDIVYAKQRFPSIVGEGDATVVVGVASVLPDNAVELRRFTVRPGNTNTNSAIVSAEVNYSIPYGASLGVLHYWQNQYQGALSVALVREGHGQFTIPTDRQIQFKLSACLSANGASGFDNSKYCEWGFLPNLDGMDTVLWTTPGLHQAWQTVHFEHTINVAAGTHTVNLASLKKVGPGTALQWYGLQGDGWVRPGAEFTVTDMGPAI